MKSTDYKMTLSNGQTIVRKDVSAGQAIEWARRNHRGLTIRRCYSGMTQAEVDVHNRMVDAANNPNMRGMAGIIEHEIPAHTAIAPDEVLKIKPEDKTVGMFDDAEVAKESDRARTATETDTLSGIPPIKQPVEPPSG